MGNCLLYLRNILYIDMNSQKLLQSIEKGDLHPPIHNNFIGACTIKVVGSQLLNKNSSKLKLNNSIKTFRTNVKQMYLPYPES